jgi:phosphoserine phosphatase
MNRLKSIAAFFDLDGTLLPSPSLEWRFISYLLRRDKLGIPNILRWLAHVGHSIPRGPRGAIAASKQYVAGLPVSLVANWAESLGTCDSHRNPLGLFDEGLNRIRWHQSQNHCVFLVTGTLAPLATCFASRLPGKAEAIATELAVSAGTQSRVDDSGTSVESSATKILPESPCSSIWTGELAGEPMVGAAKYRALQAIAMQHHLDLTNCYAYGNSSADRAMLEAVGHPEAVNPSRSLVRFAKKRGWPVSRWTSVEKAHGEPFLSPVTSGQPPRPTATEQPRS